MPDIVWLSLSLDHVRNTLNGRNDLACGRHIAVNRDVFHAMLVDIQGFGHRDTLETWAALAGAILLHRPFSVTGEDAFWVNYMAAHRTAAMWSHPQDGSCAECREARRCATFDVCILRYYKKIKARDLRTQKALIIRERPLSRGSIIQLQMFFFSLALGYKETGRSYRKRPIRPVSFFKSLFR